MRRKLKRLLGFAAAEVSLLLIVASILVGGALTLLPVGKGSSDLAVVQNDFTKIKTAITAYYLKYGHLPCPASRNDAPNSANFGKSTDCTSATAPTGTVEFGSGVNIVRIGVVPVRSLNLSDTFMFDPWNSRFTYAVIKSLAQTSTIFANYSTAATQVITIQDKTGATINPNNSATIPNYVDYVIVSHGRDANGAYSYKGALSSTCKTSLLQGKNCDDDNVFVQSAHSYTSNNLFYDDYIAWVKNTDLLNNAGLSARPGACTSGFLPTNLPSLALWLDANDLTTITKDGSNNVTKWVDKSGNAYSFANAGATKPVYSASGFNSKPTMQIIGTFGFRVASMSTSASNLSIFFAAQQTNAANANYLLDVNGTATRMTLNLNNNGATYWYKQGIYSSTLSSSYTSNTYSSWIFSNGATTPARLYINGVQVATDTTFLPQDLKGNLSIGQKYTGGATTDFSGRISEVIIYTRAVTDSERQAVEQYLKLKWGL